MPTDKSRQIKFAKRKHHKQLKRNAKSRRLRVLREQIKLEERRFGPIDKGTIV